MVCFEWSARLCSQFVDEEDYEFDHEKKKVELTREGRQKARTLPKPDTMDTVGHGQHLPVHRAGNPGRSRVSISIASTCCATARSSSSTSSPADCRKGENGETASTRLSRPRRRCDKKSEGVREGEGQCNGGNGQRPGRPHYHPGFLPPLREPGGHDRHGHGFGGGAAQDLSEPRASDSDQPAGHPPEAANGGVRRGRDKVGRRRRRDLPPARPRDGQCSSARDRSTSRSTFRRLLAERGIEHQVLNANHVAAEAEIVAQAGNFGRVTVSTNMAGRGTDIKLASDVAEMGGLHVICTEMHDSGRIDRQLIGRCGRQGDPGTYRQFLSLDDDPSCRGPGAEEGGTSSRRSASERTGRSTATPASFAALSARSSGGTSATDAC